MQQITDDGPPAATNRNQFQLIQKGDEVLGRSAKLRAFSSALPSTVPSVLRSEVLVVMSPLESQQHKVDEYYTSSEYSAKNTYW
jgi:hypothetical protein